MKAIENGESIVIGAPTGAGKTVTFIAICRAVVRQGKRVAIYCVRNTLFSQIRDVLEAEDIHVGTVAAQFRQHADATAPVQMCMLQTVARARAKGRSVPRADVVIVDEAHQQKQDMARDVFAAHREDGGVLVGFSATPTGIEHIYDRCRQSVQKSQLRAPRIDPAVLLPARVWGPSELDVRKVKLDASGEYSKAELARIMPKQIYGHVVKEYQRLNPDQRPAILFAPDVATSKWFSDEFNRQGITAAHIDGNDTYEDGVAYASSPENRSKILDRVRSGDCKVVCNRFVLREGIDLPGLYHLILACPIGSLVSYEQVVGRVLRYHESLDEVIVQDHGGNWWRHGTPNMDRNWEASWGVPHTTITKMRQDRIRDGKERVAICCEQCGSIRQWGDECHACGHRSRKSVRRVWQHSGKLKEYTGSPIPRRRVDMRQDTEKLWKAAVHRCRRSRMTFAQARGLFEVENGYSPPDTLRMMPKREIDWYATVGTVPAEDLY